MYPVKIAVAGKGGVGKTTFVCGVVQYFVSRNIEPLLLIDADPNSNLAESLGVAYTTTISDIRESLRSMQIPVGVSKIDFFNLQLQQAVVESKSFDLLVMGRPEGRECYCYVNELLRNFLNNISKTYKYVIIDAEAGMEHLSRRTTDNIDFLFILTTPTRVAYDTTKKIMDMVPKLKLKIENILVINNNLDRDEDFYKDIKFFGSIYYDSQVEKMSQEGIPLLSNLAKTKFFSDLNSILSKIFP